MKKVGHMKSGISLIVLGLVLIALLPAVPTALDQGRAAETSENYQSAVSLYRKAMADSPRDPVPARALAELFSGKNLYNLALPVWQEVIRRAPGDPSAWISLAQTWSYLDQNQRSVQVLTEASTRFPHHPDLVQSLAWMLFKTEEFHRGITLVESYISQYGSDRSLEMTLGTLYSSLLNYDVSRSHYLKSLTLASGSSADTRNFRSIAWYNLSLLEKDFYHFDLAEQDIRRSIAEEDRPAGAVALGELAEGRRNFFEARRLFQKAMKSDDTPLARFDLARLYLQFGFLQQAEEQLIQVEHHKDDSWIFNYGVTKDKLRRDLAELSAQLHRARYYRLDFLPRASLFDWGLWVVNKVQEASLWWYNEQVWRHWLTKLAQSSEAVQNSSDAWIGLSLANRDRPALALKYLFLVRNQQLPQNPNSQASFLVEEGILKHDRPLLEQALTKLQVPGENEDRERALLSLAQSASGQETRNQALEKLYELNPAALPNNGWGLPVQTTILGDPGLVKAWRSALHAYAWQTGWSVEGTNHSPFDLVLQVIPEGSTWTLRRLDGSLAQSGQAKAKPDHALEGIAQVYGAIHTPSSPSN